MDAACRGEGCKIEEGVGQRGLNIRAGTASVCRCDDSLPVEKERQNRRLEGPFPPDIRSSLRGDGESFLVRVSQSILKGYG